MKIKLNYGERVMTLPASAARKAAKTATREQLALLLLIAEGELSSLTELSEEIGASPEEVINALNYWQSSGVLTFKLDKNKLSAATKSEKPHPDKKADKASAQDRQNEGSSPSAKAGELMSSSEIPEYTLEQTGYFLETNPSASSLIDCCSQVLGKMLTPAEIKTLIGLMDYLSLSPEYILLLCGFSAETGKKSVRYIEKLAISLYDSGITDYPELEAYIEKKRRTIASDSALRSLFGIGQRSLTKREQACFFKWIGEWHYEIDVITEAYEITVTNTGKPSVPYSDAILESWHKNGLSTHDEVLSALAAYKKSKDSVEDGTFSTDDFFEAALKRSYT